MIKKYYQPNPGVYKVIEAIAEKHANVLELGPGEYPFTKANEFCGRGTNTNFSRDKLPYKDKQFDFVYCRHVLEDLCNPFLTMDEMSRVGKAGYIETPSPIVEMAKYVDGISPPYRGYIHHKFFVWPTKGVLNFVSKYPVVDQYTSIDEVNILEQLSIPHLWNSYYLWVDQIYYKFHEPELDYDIFKDYLDLLLNGVAEGVVASDNFYKKYVLQREHERMHL